ncbi:hypothetical protein B0H15DRAFT_789080 [Mycena belliarum]|uniref:Uncharacterized protein n=1 Tax=Mycena belliarum TaxID=1033014 RepID=A0AAD6TXZ0_9AGAR|nr:hypothetical protein B0H15DRAFT_789080 [Mycena belliae]
MRKAFSAFALGEKWGSEWGDLVNAWLDLEAACDYNDDGGKLDTMHRPPEVHEFIKHGRKWWAPPAIQNVGRVGEKNSYADRWWLWWRHLQPKERLWVGGMLTTPTEMTWTPKLTTMHGRVGFMQVLASLLWWGLAEAKAGDVGRASGWEDAVEDVAFLLQRLVESGELKRYVCPKMEIGRA